MPKRTDPYLLSPLEVLDCMPDGRCVMRHEGRVVFTKGGIPGDVLEVEVYGQEKKALLARIKQVLQPSADRIAPSCQHFGPCGGCKWQMMDYAAQLRWKEKQVRDAFERIAKTAFGEFRPIMGSEEQFYYRNKLEFSFSDKRWLSTEEIASGESLDRNGLGFHAPGIFDKVIDVETCMLQLPVVNEVRNALRQLALELGMEFYNQRVHTGFLRELMFRSSRATGELMLTLVVSRDEPDTVGRLFDPLIARFPQVTDWVWIHNPKQNNTYSELPARVWKGNGFVTEWLERYAFRISPTSFFQTNSRQTLRLYGVVKEFLQAALPAGANAHKLVYDLYSGTGSIGIFVSDLAQKIVGIEYVEAAVRDAWQNVKLNGLGHFHFFAGDMRKVLHTEAVQSFGAPDVVITDPPRGGMEAPVVAALMETAPKHIIYVSCNPATQARDIALLAHDYETRVLQPVDMFPHTGHVENVAWLVRKE